MPMEKEAQQELSAVVSADYLAVLRLLKCSKDRLFLTSLPAAAARLTCLQLFNYMMAGK